MHPHKALGLSFSPRSRPSPFQRVLAVGNAASAAAQPSLLFQFNDIRVRADRHGEEAVSSPVHVG